MFQTQFKQNNSYLQYEKGFWQCNYKFNIFKNTHGIIDTLFILLDLSVKLSSH